MAAARYWRLVAIRPHASGSLALSALHWYAASGRVDAAATLSCSHAPQDGALDDLKGSSAAVVVRFAAAAVRSAGFALAWDFGSEVELLYPRLLAAGQPEFLGWATLQYSNDGAVWTTDMSFGRVIYPGAGELTTADPAFRCESPGWDAASKGPAATILGREGRVGSLLSGYLRCANPKSSGRRVFGLRHTTFAGLSTFFAGFAALQGWGAFNQGMHFSMWPGNTNFWRYPGDIPITVTPKIGVPAVVGDTAYFDLDIDAGVCRLQLNDGPWSDPVTLPGFVAGTPHVIDMLAPGSTVTPWGALLLTSPDELGAHLRAGAIAWDHVGGTVPFAEFALLTPGPTPVVAASASLAIASTHGLSARLARDAEFGGSGRIFGTTKTKASPSNLPTKARVVLLHQRSKVLVRATWSDPVTGAFAFDGLDVQQEFIALAEDAAGNFRAVAAQRLAPEVAP